MTDLETDALIGQTVAGRYEVLSCLDASGDARVYQVKDARDSVIRVLKHVQSLDEDKLQQFLSEAENVKNRIKHPNLAHLYDFGVVHNLDGSSCVYLITDYLSGRSLFSILNRQGRIELAESLPIFIQIANVVRHLHAAGLSNLNLSPRKIMVTGEGPELKARLTDTGVASMLTTLNLEPGETHTTFPEGVLYLSPERCAGQPVDYRSDVYSLGCIMYECLVGLPPFLSKSPYEVSRMHVNEEAKPLRMSRDDLNFPLEIDLLVLKALRKNPHQRQQNMSELCEDLEHFQQELSRVPDLALSQTGRRSWFSNLKEDLTDLFGIDSSLRVKLVVPIIFGLIVILGSIVVAGLLPQTLRSADPAKFAEREADREWQQLDAAAQRDFDSRNYAGAEKRYLKALAIAEKYLDDRRRLLTTLQKLQFVYMAQKRFDKSDEMEARMKTVVAGEVQ